MIGICECGNIAFVTYRIRLEASIYYLSTYTITYKYYIHRSMVGTYLPTIHLSLRYSRSHIIVLAINHKSPDSAHVSWPTLWWACVTFWQELVGDECKGPSGGPSRSRLFNGKGGLPKAPWIWTQIWNNSVRYKSENVSILNQVFTNLNVTNLGNTTLFCQGGLHWGV